MNDAPADPKDQPGTPPVLPREPVQRWRLVLARDAVAPEAAQREQQGAWDAALAAAGLPVAGLDAARARPRWALAAPLGAAIPGEAELLDVWLTERLPVWRVREAILGVLPAGWRLADVHDVWLGEPALPGRVVASVYRATLAPGAVTSGQLRVAARELMDAATLPRQRRKGEHTVAYDLRPFLDALEVADDAGAGTVVRMTLRHDPERGVGRPEETLAALGDRAGAGLEPVVLVRESIVLADPPPPAPAPRRRPAPPSRRGPLDPRPRGGRRSG